MPRMATEKIIYENEAKGYQLRLTTGEFRDQEYVHLRKYFLSYEGEYVPSSEGISMPVTIQNVYSLLDGLIALCSAAEGAEVITKYFGDKLKELSEQDCRIPE